MVKETPTFAEKLKETTTEKPKARKNNEADIYNMGKQLPQPKSHKTRIPLPQNRYSRTPTSIAAQQTSSLQNQTAATKQQATGCSKPFQHTRILASSNDNCSKKTSQATRKPQLKTC
jgi:hypothetical protein